VCLLCLSDILTFYGFLKDGGDLVKPRTDFERISIQFLPDLDSVATFEHKIAITGVNFTNIFMSSFFVLSVSY
jgi:hypothetical protein